MTSRSATTGISRSVRDSYVAYRFAAALIRSNRRCRSSPTNGSACIQRLPARVCTSTVGLATRLWYQPGLLGAPAIEATTSSVLSSSRQSSGIVRWLPRPPTRGRQQQHRQIELAQCPSPGQPEDKVVERNNEEA